MTRSLRAAPAVILLGLAVAACSDTAAPPSAPSSAPETTPVQMARGGGSRRHVIVLKDGSAADLRSAVQQLGGKVQRSTPQIGVLTVDDLSDAAVASLRQRPEVQGIDADVRIQWLPPRAERRQYMRAVRPQTNQSDAFFFPAYQWYLRVIKADQAWDVSNQGAGALVCDLDSGVDPNHLDLIGKVDLSKSASFVAEEDGIVDRDGHGTAVSALIATRGIGMASTAPDAVLCQVKVLNGDGVGSFADIIAGIVYATDVGADVINMSLGAYFSRKEEGARELIRAVQRAVNYASRKGVVVVAAAGNDAVNTNRDPRDFIAIPAQLAHVISVGATAPIGQQNFDMIASYSNYGAEGVDVYAPGGDYLPEQGGVIQDLILSACSAGFVEFGCEDEVSYLFGAGTSFAAPLVAGQAAVIESQLPGDQADEVITLCILKTAENPSGKRRDRLYASGRIDVLASTDCWGGGHHVAVK